MNVCIWQLNGWRSWLVLFTRWVWATVWPNVSVHTQVNPCTKDPGSHPDAGRHRYSNSLTSQPNATHRWDRGRAQVRGIGPTWDPILTQIDRYSTGNRHTVGSTHPDAGRVLVFHLAYPGIGRGAPFSSPHPPTAFFPPEPLQKPFKPQTHTEMWQQ